MSLERQAGFVRVADEVYLSTGSFKEVVVVDYSGRMM